MKFKQEKTNTEIKQLLKHASKRYLLKSKSVMKGDGMEATYEVRLKGNDAALVSSLSQIKGVESAVMLSYDGNFTA